MVSGKISLNNDNPNINENNRRNVFKEFKFVDNDIQTIQNVRGNLKNYEENKLYTYEEALELAGNGRYNVWLLAVLSVVLTSMGLDMFGFSVVVTGCSCEFQLTQTQKGILSSMPFIGPIIMSYFWGYISDTRGRRKSLMIAMALSFVFSALSTLSPNWIVLAVFKLIATSFCNCAQSATYVILGESCSSKVRGVYMQILSSSLVASPSIHYLLGYLILGQDISYDLGPLGHYTSWRVLALVLTLPLALGSIGLLFFYESPKFLANAGRKEEALHVLRNIWMRNGGDPDAYPVKLLLIDEKNSEKPDVSFLKSIWEQTAPLFRPPLVMRTLQLFFITAVIYGSSNSFVIWLPFVANSFFGSLKLATGESKGFCDLLNKVQPGQISNATKLLPQTCHLDAYTAFAGVGLGVSFGLLNLCVAYFASRRKIMTILTLLLSFMGTVGVILTPEPVSAVVFYVAVTLTGLGSGLVTSYYVDLFPTSYRGMAACFGVIVGRVCALVGINIVGAFINSHCTATFIGGSIYVMSGVVMASFLPSDRTVKRI